jgi:hypothetical protein
MDNISESRFEELYNAGYNAYLENERSFHHPNTKGEKEAWLAGWHQAAKDFEKKV